MNKVMPEIPEKYYRLMVRSEDKRHIIVHKDLHLALKTYAAMNNITMTAAVEYLIQLSLKQQVS